MSENQSFDLTKEEILDKVKNIVCGDREAAHGNVGDTFQRIADYWKVHLQHKGSVSVTPVDVAIMMGLFKIARLEGNPYHWDYWEDLIGYTVNGQVLAVTQMNEEKKLKLFLRKNGLNAVISIGILKVVNTPSQRWI